MTRNILICLIGFVLNSCGLFKPPQVIETIKVDTIYQPVTVEIKMPGDTLVDSIEIMKPIYVDNVVVKYRTIQDTLVLAGMYATSYSWVKDNSLYGRLEEKDSIYTFKFDSLASIISIEKETTKTLVKKIKSKDKLITKIKWATGLLIVIEVLFLSFRFLKR